MNAKKILMKAARKAQHRKEIEKMSEAKAAELLRSLKKKEEQ